MCKRNIQKYFFSFLFLFILQNFYASESCLKTDTWLGFSASSVIENLYSSNIKKSELNLESFKPLLGFDLTYMYCFSTIDYSEFPDVKEKIEKHNYTFDYRNNLIIKFDLGCYSAFPTAAGIVEKRDFSIDVNNNLINYYNHNLITDKDYSLYSNICLQAGNETFNLGFGYSARYSNIKIESDAGYLQYATNGTVWTGTETKQYLNGSAISYEQSRKLFGYVFFVDSVICKKVPLDFIVYYYPRMTVDSISNNFLHSEQFIGTMKKGFDLDLSLTSGWIFDNENIFYCKLNYNFFNVEGKTHVNSLGIITNNTNNKKEYYKTGTEYFNWIFSLGLSIRL